MGLLTDTDIAKILVGKKSEMEDSSLLITPYDKTSLTPVGYDLRVGSPYACSDYLGRKSLKKGKFLEINPNSTALITTREDISMPRDRSISGFIKSKVTKVSMGLSHISTTVDPDWSGNLLIAVHNHSGEVYSLEFGETFCTIVFIRNETPSTGDCGKKAGREDALLTSFEETARIIESKKSLKNSIKVMRLSEDARLPRYAHSGDAGMDLFASHDAIIGPSDVKLIKTGISIELPEDTEAQIRPKSGLALKDRVSVLNTPGTIDEGYRGEIGVILINHGDKAFSVEKGMKIAQMVIKPVIRLKVTEVKELSDSPRGEGGFGSTGR